MLGWMKHKLESRMLGEISITSDDTTLMAESEEELKSLLMKVKEESEKVSLKLNIPKTKIMASGSIQFSSVTHTCPTLCDPRDCSTPGLPHCRSILYKLSHKGGPGLDAMICFFNVEFKTGFFTLLFHLYQEVF